MKKAAFLFILSLVLAAADGKAQDEEAHESYEAGDAKDEPPLSYLEVMEGMKQTMFRSDVETCVSDWVHPGQISMKFTIGADGAVSLTSIEPAPPKDVYLCIAGAVSLLQFRATGKVTPVKFAYSLPPPPLIGRNEKNLEPAPKKSVYEPPTTVEKVHKYPGGKRAGVGFYGAFVVLNHGVNNLTAEPDDIKVKWYGQLTGGIGLFGEYLLVPFFALGMELSIFFPFVKEIKHENTSRAGCEECEQSFLFNILVRAKFPIRIIPQASVFPMVLFGYSSYLNRVETKQVYTYHGLGVGAGIGIENYTSFAIPFFELRYLLHAGWFDPHLRSGHPDSDTKGRLLDHNFMLNLGLRFP